MIHRKDPAWWKLKDRAKERGGQLCEYCRLRPVYALHHRHYDTRYRERLRDVMVVCDPCHKAIHKRLSPGKRIEVARGSLAAAGDSGFGLTRLWLGYLVAGA